MMSKRSIRVVETEILDNEQIVSQYTYNSIEPLFSFSFEEELALDIDKLIQVPMIIVHG